MLYGSKQTGLCELGSFTQCFGVLYLPQSFYHTQASLTQPSLTQSFEGGVGCFIGGLGCFCGPLYCWSGYVLPNEGIGEVGDWGRDIYFCVLKTKYPVIV